MTIELALRLLGGILLVGANAFFVAVEFALTRLRQFSPDDIPEDDKGLQTAWEMTERLEIHLTGCQLGISATSIVLGVVAEPAVTELLHPLFDLAGLTGGTASATSVVVAVVVINLIHKIWGEQAPTYLGVERPLLVAGRLAPILRIWSTVMDPVIRLGDGLAKLTLGAFGVEVTRSWTREDEGTAGAEERPAGEEAPGGEAGEKSYGDLRRRLVEVLSGADVARERQQEIVHALDIEQIPVREVMVPTDRVVSLSLAESLDENLDRIGRTRHVRYPLLDADGEEFVGTIYVPALFEHRKALERGEKTLGEVATPGVRVDADLPVSELIDRLQEESQELAFVEEEGEVVGLVTITDAFEEIAGEVEDPYD
ncbi:MAG: CNNM domain-containing protein [Longimicrobiales bacterium]|nr:CNNM domain-containing protein [Longimicrobiales bacterium]